MRRRAAAVAGMFYPADGRRLRAEITGYLDEARASGAADASPPKAIIAPHAGTMYSGPVAASAYARLEARSHTIARVILLGPAHRVWFEGLATSSADAFESPLGDVPVDREMVEQLEAFPFVNENDEAHRREHSLEVHLPFLQEVLAEFVLVPLVVGQTNAVQVAAVLDAVWGGDETLIVISSDLSHYHPYVEAQAIDRETTGMIERLELEKLSGERACGYQPIRGLLYTARARGLSVTNIDLRSSGDTAGPRGEVVGYGSYVVS